VARRFVEFKIYGEWCRERKIDGTDVENRNDRLSSASSNTASCAEDTLQGEVSQGQMAISGFNFSLFLIGD